MKKIKLFEQFEEEKKANVFTVTKAPDKLPEDGRPSIFLAGSIEMGKAEDWQSKIQDLLKDENVAIYNPRRDDWDSSWEQVIENPQFREQVEWELRSLKLATVIVMYFDPKTQSPITLLELGIHSESQKLLVCCPEGYWKKGNVDVVCALNGIPMYDTVDALAAAAMTKINSLQ